MRNRTLLTAFGQHCAVTVGTTGTGSTVGRLTTGLLQYARRRPEHDMCFAGFYGQPIAIALARMQQQPIILDAYVSTFDTLCEDRRTFGPRSPAGRLAFWLDRAGCEAAGHVITDTAASARYFRETFGVPTEKLTPVYVGCDEGLFYPRPERPADRGRCEVFYYGAFLPLHGSAVIVEAAHLLRDRPDIHFTLGGDGPEYNVVRKRIEKLGLTNIELLRWIPVEQLPGYIARATICLGGHFSTVPKAGRVISTKTFQFVAMRKPTIMGDNSATRELFMPGEHVLAVAMGDSTALAAAIAELADDAGLRRRLANGGYEIYQQRASGAVLSRQMAAVLEQISCASAS